jgi:DNA-binding SARP family transcriptional activator/tetratricopeptide (TPR) repeat protein
VDTRLEFGILGPLEVRCGGTLVHVGGPRQRALLGLLLCHANRVVSRDELIEELLADQPAGPAERMLRVQISRLRKVLAEGDTEPRLLPRRPGYFLRVEDGELDLQVFEQRVGAGQHALEQGDPGQAMVLLGEAESLWRGRPLADLEFERFARFEIQRLQEQRLAVVEDRIEAELALGHHSALCAELGQLVAEHPLRERLRGQLMLALYRSGRQAESLTVFHDTRQVLDAELGIEPGPGLRQLHERVLGADPALDVPGPVVLRELSADVGAFTGLAAARGRGPSTDVLADRPGSGPGAFQATATRALPRDIAAFTGRRAELAQLTGTLAGLAADGGVVGIHAIGGMAGIGKTTFAVHAAHRLAGSFSDGQFFLPLHAHTAGQRPVEPADALASLLLAAGVPALQIPPDLETRAARWRDCVAGKKILLVLDDAAGHEQVRPLLPATAGSLVLVTSRRRLTALEDAAVISLDILSPNEAAALLVRLAARPGLDPEDAAVGEITRLCGYLPLAIGMLAGQLRHRRSWSAAHLSASLAQARDRLALMQAENLSVVAAFDLSYADLSPDQQRLFRRLGLVPGPRFDAYAAAALDDASLDAARRHLDALFDQHLLTEPAPGRYQLHDLLREHARALAAADHPAESDAAAERLLDYYLHTALAAGRHNMPRPAAYSDPPPTLAPAHAPDVFALGPAAGWLEAERTNLLAAADYAAASGRTQHAVRLAAAMAGFLFGCDHWDQAAVLYRTVLAAACQAGDRLGQALTLTQLGNLSLITGDLRSAAASLAQGVDLYRAVGDDTGQIDALMFLAGAQTDAGDFPAAAASLRQALALAGRLGDRLGQAQALVGLGVVQLRAGDYLAAATSLRQALALFRETGQRIGEAVALGNLGWAQCETGDYPAAATSLQQALTLFRETEYRLGQAGTLEGLGVVQLETGDYAAAAISLQQALNLYRGPGDRADPADPPNSHRNRTGEAAALNSLGWLASRTTQTRLARDHHAQALAIARDIGVPLEEGRALEGIGQSCLQEGNPGQAVTYLQQALTIYQRLGSPYARRVQKTLRRCGPQPANPRPAHH